MCKNKDREMIYLLIEMYLSGKMNEIGFCDAFVPLYNVELDYSCLTDEEHMVFSELDAVAGRFSQFKEDHQELPGFFSNEKQVRKKIEETKNKLSKYFY